MITVIIKLILGLVRYFGPQTTKRPDETKTKNKNWTFSSSSYIKHSSLVDKKIKDSPNFSRELLLFPSFFCHRNCWSISDSIITNVSRLRFLTLHGLINFLSFSAFFDHYWFLCSWFELYHHNLLQFLQCLLPVIKPPQTTLTLTTPTRYVTFLLWVVCWNLYRFIWDHYRLWIFFISLGMFTLDLILIESFR